MAPDIIDLTNDPAKLIPDPFGIKYPLLRVALKHITLLRLVQVVESICVASDTTGQLFEEHLLAPTSPVPIGKKRPASIDVTEKEANDLKRSKIRYVKCVRCEESFDVENNHKGDCEWHPGEREIDESWPCWAEHDENYWEHDYEDYGPSCADGFMWTCCENSADALPCKVGRHREEGMDTWNGAWYAIGCEDSDESTVAEESESELDSQPVSLPDSTSESESEPEEEDESEKKPKAK